MALNRQDLWSLEEYAVKRPSFREQVIAHKKNRQIALDPHATLYFEDAMTMQYQIQEMLRVERIFNPEEIEEELAASTADLEGEQVLLLEDGHCLRDQALAVCQAHHGEESKNYSATSLETLKQLVAADMGITLMPELAVAQIRNAAATGIRYIPFASDTPYRTLGLCWRSTSTRAELLRQLADELKQMVNAGG